MTTTPSTATLPHVDLSGMTNHAPAGLSGPAAPGGPRKPSGRQRSRMVMLGGLCTAGWLASVLVGHNVDWGPEVHRIGPRPCAVLRLRARR